MAFFEKAKLNQTAAFALSTLPNAIQNDLVKYRNKKTGEETAQTVESAVVVAQHKVIVQVPPSTTVSSSLLNGGLIEFRLEKGYIDTLDHIYVLINITNNTGAAVVLQPSMLLFDHWEIYAQNGNRLLFQKFAHEMWCDLIYMAREQFEVLAPQLNTTNQ